MNITPILFALLALCLMALPSPVSAAPKPNVIFFFIDDMGYGDIGPFGNTVNKTPHLDRMATEGTILRQYYVSNTACTPSRSALMTGTYAHRIGMDGNVLFPGETRGLNPSEITIAEIMKTKGYATGCFGKWHLGDQPEFLPLAQGFDEYFGIPYSNDMWPGNTRNHRFTKKPYTPLPVVRQNEAVAYVADGPDQSLLCEVVTDEAVKFIRNHKDEPFFLYIPHAYVHNPRFARKEIFEKAEGNVNRATVEEIDTSVGRVLDTLRELGLEKDTLVIFTSDNGGAGGMSMGPLRGNKGGPKYEGHMREPTISWWPGTIPAGGVTDEIVATVDMLPSLAKLVGADVPRDRIIDGKDALDVILGKPGAKSPHKILYYENDGIRRGNWKLVKGQRGKLELYDLESDIGETKNLIDKYPDMVAELKALLDNHAQEIADNQRPAAFVDEAEPIISEPGDLPKLRTFMGLPDFKVEPNTQMPKPTKQKARKKPVAAVKAPEGSPHILFIAIDDMNDWSTLFDPDNPIKTPNLERLAARGTFFSKAYCAVPGCNPSRTALLTGLLPTTSGVYTNGNAWRKALPDAVTLPKYFENNGYATRGAGKIFHHGPSGAEDPNNPSFQDFFKMLPPRKTGPNYNGYTEGSVSKTSGDWGEHKEKMIDIDTVEWVEARMKEQWDRPLFLAAGLFRPHLPHYAPPAIFAQYPFDETKMPLMPKNDLDDIPPLGLAMAHTQFERYNKPATSPVDSPGSLKKLVQSYQASATFADTMVGRLLDTLDASGRADNTIIVLWADHGYHLGDKENCVKFTLWEKANRVPFIIVAPGQTKPGSRCDRPVSLVDLYPTLLELAGLPPKADNDGQSLVPLLKNPKREWKRPAVMTQGRGNHAVRSDHWRYIRYEDGTEELYDHDKDPWEITNLASKPEYAKVIAEHKKWLPKTEKITPPSAPKGHKTQSGPGPKKMTPLMAATLDDPNAILIADFEGKSYGDWKTTGEAFGDGPARANINPPRNKVAGYLGKGLVNTYLGGDKPTGTLTSPAFRIERKYINFLIGAGKHPGQTCMNLLINGKTVRTATGPSLKDENRDEVLLWHSWDVAELANKEATLQILDKASAGWGHINIDHIIQSDKALVTAPPVAAPKPKPVSTAPRPQDLSAKELAAMMEEYAGRPDAYNEAYRPQFHFSPMTGWMNDPNGLVYYDGEYHLFFQAWPQNVRAGGKIWSHAVSRDLMHWKQIEHALLNEGSRQIYSGSAVIDHDNSAGFQTGDEKTLIAVYTLTAPFDQCIAYSNDRGRTFTKIKKPAVAEINRGNRDPKVFWHEASKKWVMIFYLSKREEFILMGSKNLKEWTKLSDVRIPNGHECPEMFELPIDGDKSNTRWVVWEAKGDYMLGKFDGTNFTPDAEEVLPTEWGANCYAGQTWNDSPDGRRIFIGWMHAKAGKHVSENIYADMPFTQQMTFPREFSLRSTPEGLRLFAMPVKEIERLRGPVKSWPGLTLKPGQNPLLKITGDLFDIEAEIRAGEAKTITLDVRGTPIVYDFGTQELSCLGKTIEAPPIDGRLKLRVLVDRTSIEIFVNGGRYVMSFCFRSDADKRSLSLRASGGNAKFATLKVWPLESIWR